MSDHPQHIVRPLHRGERIPHYSTAALLYGCAPSPKRPIVEEKPVFVRPPHLPQHETIVSMLKAGASNPEIAKKTDLSVCTVRWRIRQSDELKKLSESRHVKRRSGPAGKYRTLETERRLRELGPQIRAAATEMKLYQVAKEFGFGAATLKLFLGGGK